MQVYSSIVDNNIMESFKNLRGSTLINNAANSCGIEEVLSVANLLCPEIVEVKGYIFISEFYNGNIDSLEKQFNYDRKRIEMFVNSWSLADFFLQAGNESVHVDRIIEEFGKVIQYFWQRRLKEVFPTKEVTVEIGDEIMGENGLTITVFQGL